VRAELAAILRCPACHREGMTLTASTCDRQEVRDGELLCAGCANTFPIQRGVAHLLHDPPAHIEAEARGLERFAERMRLDGWDRSAVRSLPYRPHGYWHVQARSIHQLLTTVDFQRGQRLLDVGSNTCWATNHFAERGLQSIALDIVTTELQGLHTADYFIDDGSVFFERVLGTMTDIPLATGSLDYVYCCEVMHHNDPQSLRRTFMECYRVLRPGGRLLVVNETLKVLKDPVGVHTENVAEYDGYEHAHWALTYIWSAVRAGFQVELLEPQYVPFFGDSDLYVRPHTPSAQAIREGFTYALRGNALARRAYLAWLYLVTGRASLSMVGTKLAGDPGTGARSRIRRAKYTLRRLSESPEFPKAPQAPVDNSSQTGAADARAT
jgi:SAM-dependent methyltransferase